MLFWWSFMNDYSSRIEQQIELGSSRFMNCITTVTKDGMLLIKENENETICGHIENREK